MRVYSHRAGRTRSSQAASIAARRVGHGRLPGRRLGDLGQALEGLGHGLGGAAGRACPCLRKKACLSWEMSHVSVTKVPPSTGFELVAPDAAADEAAEEPGSTVCQAMRRSCSNSITVLDMV